MNVNSVQEGHLCGYQFRSLCVSDFGFVLAYLYTTQQEKPIAVNERYMLITKMGCWAFSLACF
ncbi:MAG: hypothetical protein R3E79_55880 [Caldilineaceae bacterium]